MLLYSDCIVLVPGDVSSTNIIKDEAGNPVILFRGDYVRWVDTGGAAADVANLVHSKGNPIFASVASVANFVDWQYVLDDARDGFMLTALTHGTLYIFRSGGRPTI